MPWTWPVLALATGLIAPPSALVSLSPEADNTMYEGLGTSNGAGDYLFSGLTLRGAGERRALLRFELGAIPPGATVHTASLTLHCSRTSAPAGPMSLHRLTAGWGEGTSDAGEPGGQGADPTPGDATWTHRAWPALAWAMPGGEFVPAPSATAIVAGLGPAVWGSSPALVADVQRWVDDPTRNHGWILIAPPVPGDARRFNSREHPDPQLRPVLHVRYVVWNPAPQPHDATSTLGRATIPPHARPIDPVQPPGLEPRRSRRVGHRLAPALPPLAQAAARLAQLAAAALWRAPASHVEGLPLGPRVGPLAAGDGRTRHPW